MQARKKVFNLILLGDPASGKATQAARLVRRYGFYDLDMGKEVRKPSTRKIYDYAHTTRIGRLTPTPVVRSIFRNIIRTVPPTRGILFDGTPKMMGEAQLVAKLLRDHHKANPIVIYLHIPAREVSARVRKRREYVAGKLRRREDDNVRALKNRQKYYQTQIVRVIKFFKQQYVFKKISGVGTRAKVFRRIVRYLQHRI